jgi:hypothetical protein
MEKNYKSLSDQTNETDQDRFLKEEAYLKAQNKVKRIMGFYRHLIIYAIINVFLIVLISSNKEGSFFSFETFSTAFFWGIGLAFHALGVFGPDLVFGKSWENRMIKKYMDKENTRWE